MHNAQSELSASAFRPFIPAVNRRPIALDDPLQPIVVMAKSHRHQQDIATPIPCRILGDDSDKVAYAVFNQARTPQSHHSAIGLRLEGLSYLRIGGGVRRLFEDKTSLQGEVLW